MPDWVSSRGRRKLWEVLKQACVPAASPFNHDVTSWVRLPDAREPNAEMPSFAAETGFVHEAAKRGEG